MSTQVINRPTRLRMVLSRIGRRFAFAAICAFVAAVMLASDGLNANTFTAEAAAATVTFGYLRMSGIDNADIMVGLLSALKYVNDNNLVRDTTFSLDVITIPCGSKQTCDPTRAIAGIEPADSSQGLSIAAYNAYIVAFLNSMGKYSAVFKPNHLLAPLVIDKATELGGIPVIDPQTIRKKDFESPSYHVINFERYMPSEMLHLFKYMQQDDGCAYSGVIYDRFSEMPDHIEALKKLFSDGGLPPLATLDVTTAAFTDYTAFFGGEPRRRCYFALATYDRLIAVMSAVIIHFNVPEEGFVFRFYGPSLLSAAQYALVNGLTWPLKYTHFVTWTPPYDANSTFDVAEDTRQAYTAWKADAAEQQAVIDKQYVGVRDILPTSASTFMMAGHLLIRFAVELYRKASSTDFSLIDDTKAVPLQHASLINAYYDGGNIAVGNFQFQQGVKGAAPKPFPQRAFCNTASQTSYLYQISGTNGVPFPVFDDESKGRREAASLVSADPCKYLASSDVYPLTLLMIGLSPSHMLPMPGNGISLQVRLMAQTKMTAVVDERLRLVNGAPSPPARPYNFATWVLQINHTTAHEIAFATTSHNAFVVLGSFEGTIRPKASANTLVLMPSMMDMVIDEDPLVPIDQWDRNTISLQPTLSDIIHALASCFHRFNEHVSILPTDDGAASSAAAATTDSGTLRKFSAADALTPPTGRFDGVASAESTEIGNNGLWIGSLSRWTALHCIAASTAEATLMSKSLQTFGYNVTLNDIIVSASGAEWSTYITRWITASDAPFIFASTVVNVDNTGTNAYRIVATHTDTNSRARLALGGIEPTYGYYAFSFSGGPDVLFATILDTWWSDTLRARIVPETMRESAKNPMVWAPMVATDLAVQLGQRVSDDYTAKAADILYQQSVFSALEIPLGPFSMAECSDSQIAANEKNRVCQCKKGVRTINVLSARNWKEKVVEGDDSFFAFRFTMATCGVVHKNYVAPPIMSGSRTIAAAASSSLLSRGAIIGIAIGGGVALFVLLGIVMFFLFFSGRNNSAAPKDSSKPFAVVFTDIQSSTSLWSRVPSIMSEAVAHHHRIIRKQIRYNNGYEVKTIGDSFMVAFNEPTDAVAFALDVQERLFTAEWDEEINATYEELLVEAAAEVEGHQNVSNNTPRNNFTSSPTGGGIDGGGATDGSTVGGPTTMLGTMMTPNTSAAHGGGAITPLPAHLASHPHNNYNNTNGIIQQPHRQSDAGTNGVVIFEDTGSSVAGPSLMMGGGGGGGAIGGTTNNTQNVYLAGNNNNNNAVMLLARSDNRSATFDGPLSRSGDSALMQMASGGGVGVGGGANTTSNQDSTSNFADVVRTMGLNNTGNTPGAAPVAATAHYLSATPMTGTFINASDSFKAAGDDGHHHMMMMTDPSNGVISTFTNHARAASNRKLWNGLRVRIGVSYGLGDIRKDPVSQGYDYYGTVVNTAARVEGVGHGGQNLITDATLLALPTDFFTSRGINGTISLGLQPLRGLDAPVTLVQVSPAPLIQRRFPPLRLHIEVDDIEENTKESTENSTKSRNVDGGEEGCDGGEGGLNADGSPKRRRSKHHMSPEQEAHQLIIDAVTQMCSSKQYAGLVAAEELLYNFHLMTSLMAPAPKKWRNQTVVRLADAWGFEKAQKAVSHDSTKIKLLIAMLGKATKAFKMSNTFTHISTHNSGGGGVLNSTVGGNGTINTANGSVSPNQGAYLRGVGGNVGGRMGAAAMFRPLGSFDKPSSPNEINNNNGTNNYPIGTSRQSVGGGMGRSRARSINTNNPQSVTIQYLNEADGVNSTRGAHGPASPNSSGGLLLTSNNGGGGIGSARCNSIAAAGSPPMLMAADVSAFNRMGSFANTNGGTAIGGKHNSTPHNTTATNTFTGIDGSGGGMTNSRHNNNGNLITTTAAALRSANSIGGTITTNSTRAGPTVTILHTSANKDDLPAFGPSATTTTTAPTATAGGTMAMNGTVDAASHQLQQQPSTAFSLPQMAIPAPSNQQQHQQQVPTPASPNSMATDRQQRQEEDTHPNAPHSFAMATNLLTASSLSLVGGVSAAVGEGGGGDALLG